MAARKKPAARAAIKLEELRSTRSAPSWLMPCIGLLVLAGLFALFYFRGDPAETPIAEVAPAPGFTKVEPIPPPIPIAEDPRGCKIEPKVTVRAAPLPPLPRSAWRPKTSPPPYAGGDYRSMFHTKEEKPR